MLRVSLEMGLPPTSSVQPLDSIAKSGSSKKGILGEDKLDAELGLKVDDASSSESQVTFTNRHNFLIQVIRPEIVPGSDYTHTEKNWRCTNSP